MIAAVKGEAPVWDEALLLAPALLSESAWELQLVTV
jgi:hypothetical protein